jgi:hypothetical protein
MAVLSAIKFDPLNVTSAPLTIGGDSSGSQYPGLTDPEPPIAFGPTIQGSPAQPGFVLSGIKLGSFFDDYYNRIHVDPLAFELGPISSQQVRQFSIWNAYTDSDFDVVDIQVTNGAGINVAGELPPFVLHKLQENFYTVTISAEGPPEINAEIRFIFDDLPASSPVIITGTRAIIFPYVPEIPVQETWSWLTDVMVSNDGQEQRVGLRASPRVAMAVKYLSVTQDEIRRIQTILTGSKNAFWVPYYQYATNIKTLAPAGATAIEFDQVKTDVRNLEYVLITSPGERPALLRLLALTPTGATVEPLAADIPKNSLIVPCFSSMIENNGRMRRYGVNDAAETTLETLRFISREQFQRPGSTATLELFNSIPVLDRRPLANDLIDDDFDFSGDLIDYNIGAFRNIINWDFVKNIKRYQFQIERYTDPTDLDYWRLFFDTVKGQLKPFYLSSYRPDQEVALQPAPGDNSIRLTGTSYYETFFNNPNFRGLELTFNSGLTQLVNVTEVSTLAGNTVITLDQNLLSSGWASIAQVSYLQKMRLNMDDVQLQHFGLYSTFQITTRTVQE